MYFYIHRAGRSQRGRERERSRKHFERESRRQKMRSGGKGRLDHTAGNVEGERREIGSMCGREERIFRFPIWIPWLLLGVCGAGVGGMVGLVVVLVVERGTVHNVLFDKRSRF